MIVSGRSRSTLSLLGLLLIAAACGERDSAAPDGIDRSAFVAAYIDLRAATVAGVLDDATRDSILARHDVTEADLRAWIEQRSDDPAALSEAWREVTDSTAARDSAAAAETDSLEATS